MKKHYENPIIKVMKLKLESRILESSGENMYNNNLGTAINLDD